MGKNLTRKILEAHLAEGRLVAGEEIGIRIDQILAQDLTATQAFLHFEAMGISRIRCKVAACYADHNVLHISPEKWGAHFNCQREPGRTAVGYARQAPATGTKTVLKPCAVPADWLLGSD